MAKYQKVTDREVLEKYHEVQSTHYGCGSWLDWISVDMMADILHTSKYQVRNAYKRLTEQGYMELSKVGTYYEDYYNGLYDVAVPILYARVYVLTKKAIQELEGRK